MARVKKIKKKETKEGIEHREVWVDTKTGKEFGAPFGGLPEEELKEVRELPEEERKTRLTAAAREREGLPMEPKQVSAEVTRLQEERKVERGEEELPPEELPVIQEEGLEEQTPPEQTYTDPNTGKETILHSGQVMPVTAEDLTDVVTLFTGLGLGKVGVKFLGKQAIKKGGLIGINAVKVGMLNVIKRKLFGLLKISSKKLGTIGTGIVLAAGISVVGQLIAPYAGQRVTAVDRQIQSLDSELSQIRETITAPVQLVASGVPSSEGLEIVDEMKDSILSIEQKIKELEINSQQMKTNPEFTAPAKRRIQKLLYFIDLSERQILQMQVTGRVPTTEELAYLMALYEPLLKE